MYGVRPETGVPGLATLPRGFLPVLPIQTISSIPGTGGVADELLNQTSYTASPVEPIVNDQLLFTDVS